MVRPLLLQAISHLPANLRTLLAGLRTFHAGLRAGAAFAALLALGRAFLARIRTRGGNRRGQGATPAADFRARRADRRAIQACARTRHHPFGLRQSATQALQLIEQAEQTFAHAISFFPAGPAACLCSCFSSARATTPIAPMAAVVAPSAVIISRRFMTFSFLNAKSVGPAAM